MKNNYQWMLVLTIAFCGAGAFTACTDSADNPSVVEPKQEVNEFLDEEKGDERMKALYGENKKITDGNYDKSLAVKCINGTFVGKRTDGVVAFKGIPFVGQQPVGELRWKAPVECVADDGIYEAYYNGKSPCQVEDVFQIASHYPQGEDCLYLNVWKAEGASAATRPVIVWIHGGAFEVGGTSEPREEGSNFVRENPGVILVSIEYRLGVFGFLHLSHLPDGADYPDAQNLGLLDQVMGLKWVHENIAAFGGDPGNVTIMGQSAGGGSVTSLPLIAGSQQYFKKVIAMSGAPVFTRSTQQSIACTDNLMAALGCKTVADLQKVDVRKIVDTASDLLDLRVWAERDGRILPLDPYEAYANGAAKDITFLQGCTKDEMGYFVYGFGLDAWNSWAVGRKAEKMAQMTSEEKALVESYCQDAKDVTTEYSSTTRLFDQMQVVHLLLDPRMLLAIIEERSCHRAFGGIQASGGDPRHGKAIRRDLLEDPAPHVGAVCQDGQSVAQRIRVARRQGQGVAALRPGEQTADDLRRVQHPSREGIAAENPRLGPHLFPDQVLLHLIT